MHTAKQDVRNLLDNLPDDSTVERERKAKEERDATLGGRVWWGHFLDSCYRSCVSDLGSILIYLKIVNCRTELDTTPTPA